MSTYFESEQSQESVIYASAVYVGDHVIDINPEDEYRAHSTFKDQSVLFDPEDD